ncbi:MAG: hypothetical protein KC503_27185 [Myxococcales bacterium]|nr:hypothetical protein [Myxococcales bacterium]
MSRKKTKKNKKKPSDGARQQKVREVLAAEALAEDAGVMMRWARAVTGGGRGEPPDEPDDALAAALVDHLVDVGDGEALTWLAEGGSSERKALVKPARAGLHRLRSRGVDVDVPSGRSAPLGTGLDPSPPPPSLVSVYDGRDQRLIWLAELNPEGGLTLFQARASARVGLLEFHSGPIGRKAYRQLVREVRENLRAAQVTPDVARWYIRDAAERAERAERGLPDAYLRASGHIAETTLQRHPALSIEPASAPAQALLSLYDALELRGWVPEREEAQRLLLRYQEIQTSQLMVDENQRRSQMVYASEQWLARYFEDAARREAARQVLLDTAHLCAELDRETPAASGPSRAALLAEAALLFAADDVAALTRHPFVRRFIERVIPLPAAMPATDPSLPGGGGGGAAPGGGIIITGS